MPFIPHISIVTAVIISVFILNQKRQLTFISLYLLIISIWPFAFMSIYNHTNTRLAASQWIYENIKPGSKISCEHWDDCLPMNLKDRNASAYSSIRMEMYNKESPEKYEKIYSRLVDLDYIILSSNRVYASTMSVPKRYPISNKFYSDLFSGRLGFVKVAQFTSRPKIYIPGVSLCLKPPFLDYGIAAKLVDECDQNAITLIDDFMDESFTVYDHPKVLIFKKVKFN